MLARLGVYLFLASTVHLQELPGHSQQRSLLWFSVLEQGRLLPVPVTCCKSEKRLPRRMLSFATTHVSGQARTGYFCRSLHYTLASQGGTSHPRDSFQTWVGPAGSKTASPYWRGRGRQKKEKSVCWMLWADIREAWREPSSPEKEDLL